jgi:DNA-binding CsgD family transcriptional regulator
MALSTRHRRVADLVTDACRAAKDARRLRLHVLELLEQAVGYEAYAWLLTDPETAVGASPIADVPSVARLPELIRLKYLTTVNRWTSMPTAAARLRHVTDGDMTRSRLWRELLSEYGVGDVLSVVFADTYGCWGFLDLWRFGKHSTFTLDEEELLRVVASSVTTALRESQAASFIAVPAAGARTPSGEAAGPVVLLLDRDLVVSAQTPQTEAYLRAIVPTEEGRRPVPATAYNVGAQLLAVEAGVDRHVPVARLHLAHGQWVTMSAARLGATGPLDGRAIAVTLQTVSPADRVTLFARACGLTARESELLRHLSDGTDTRQLARRLDLSEHTVQDHLKAIFAKTATGSRVHLLSRALGS